jgi:tol-pal system protein YbgF
VPQQVPAPQAKPAPEPAPAGQLAVAATRPGAEEAYDAAYGRVLNGDHTGAERAFSDFLKRYPSHRLAGNAQYWLAETYYVRGDYKQAAKGFLKGYKDHGASDKAPDSLLKLGMSLAELGEKVQACASLAEVAERFADARAAVRERAVQERDRIGC